MDDREFDAEDVTSTLPPSGPSASGDGAAGARASQGSGSATLNAASDGAFASPELTLDRPGAAPQRVLSLGQECSASSEPCDEGLRCVSGSCRVPCVTAADCSTLGSEVDCTVGAALDGSGVGACDYRSYCDPAHPQTPASGASPCPAGSGCRPSISGESACQPQPGSGTAGSACSSDADCTVDRFCGEQGTCLRYCVSNADCGSDVCSPFAVPRRAGNLAVGFCAGPDCDPVRPQSPRDGLSACPEGQGCDAVQGATRSSCAPRTGAGVRYDRCEGIAACQPGLFCATGTAANSCNQYCFSDADCPGERCRPLRDPAVLAGGHAVGICVAACNPANPASSEGGFGTCPPGFGCAPSEDGLTFCYPEGTRQPYERCSELKECGVGHACDAGPYQFCKRMCLSNADCGQGVCELGTVAAGMLNVGRCAEGCSPVDPQSAQAPFSPCPAGFGCLPADRVGESRCILAGSGRSNAPCTDHPDCAPGFLCDTAAGICREYCFTNSDCQRGFCDGIIAPANLAADRVVSVCVE